VTEIILDPGPLPVGAHDHKGPSWWGVLALICTEGALFAYLLFSYFYFDVQLPHSWRPPEPPKINLSGPNTVILILSSLAVWFGERSLKKGRRGLSILGIAIGLLLGCVFVGIQGLEWKAKHFTPATDAYGSLFFVVTGFHMAHVVAGLFGLAAILLWDALGYFDRTRNAAVANVSTYWHFVDAVWLCVFFTFYITPRLW
jgi:heme/copper-type cytochrome/quinol oxidase subunit 3